MEARGPGKHQALRRGGRKEGIEAESLKIREKSVNRRGNGAEMSN